MSCGGSQYPLIPECNPSGVIDAWAFGDFSMYLQGEAGYYPEGLLMIFSVLSNVLLGCFAGLTLFWQRGSVSFCLIVKKIEKNSYIWQEATFALQNY